MHAIQSALAIRRQRHRRQEQVRAKRRRFSSLSDDLMSPTGSSPRGSVISLDGKTRSLASRIASRQQKILDSKAVATDTTFHVGVVFILMGIMLILGSLIPEDIGQDWWQLFTVGCLLLVVGIILTVFNRLAAAREEDRFQRYIKKKLARNRHQQMKQAVSPNNAEISQLVTDPNEPHKNKQQTMVLSTSQLECIIEDTEAEKHEKTHVRFINEMAPVHMARIERSLSDSD